MCPGLLLAGGPEEPAARGDGGQEGRAASLALPGLQEQGGRQTIDSMTFHLVALTMPYPTNYSTYNAIPYQP